MDYTVKLLERVGSLTPLEKPEKEDWDRLESGLKFELPQDFKCLVSSLGTGMFGSGFYLFNPKAHGDLQLSKVALLEWQSIAAPMLENVDLKFFPQQNGAVHIGHCAARCDLFFRPDPLGAILTYCDFNREIVVDMQMSVSEFICKLYDNSFDEFFLIDLSMSVWLSQTEPFFRSFPSKPNGAVASTSRITADPNDSVEDRIKKLEGLSP
jgi:hypothetical protein